MIGQFNLHHPLVKTKIWAGDVITFTPVLTIDGIARTLQVDGAGGGGGGLVDANTAYDPMAHVFYDAPSVDDAHALDPALRNAGD